MCMKKKTVNAARLQLRKKTIAPLAVTRQQEIKGGTLPTEMHCKPTQTCATRNPLLC